MKLPRIVADQGIPASIPGGYATANEFGAGAAQELGQGAQQFERSAERTSRVYAYAADVLEQAKAKAELDGAVTAFKGQMTDADIALKEQGIDPDQYPQALRAAVKDRASAISDQITSPLAKTAFASHASALAETKLSAAKYDALTMKNGLIQTLEAQQQVEDANTAVNGATTEDRQAAMQRLLERPERGLREGRYTAAQATQMRSTALKNVETGGIFRDYRNPDLRAGVISTLVHGGYTHMTAEEQFKLADQLQAKSDQENRQLHEATEKWWKEKQAQTVSDLYSQAAAKTLTPAALEQARVDWRLSREDFAAIQNEMQKPLDDRPSDPATLERLDIAVHAQNPTATDREINALRAQGLLSRKDALAYKDHLNTRLEAIKNRGESIQMQHHNQAEQEARAAFNIPAAADKYEGNQGKVWAAYLRELTARSNAYGGQEDALKVNEEIVPRFKAVLGEDARLEVDKLKGLLNPKYQTWPALKAARDSGAITPGEYEAQAKTMLDLSEAMTRQQAVDDEARKLAAEREKRDAERKHGIWQRLNPFGAPPANAPTKPKDMGRQ